MAIEKGGIPITGFISPNDITDTYPTHKDKYGSGGHRTVDNETALFAISTDRRTEGMLAYVKDVKKLYQLIGGITNDKWQEVYTVDQNGIAVNIDCPTNYILEGDLAGIAKPSPALLDIRLDLIDIKTAKFVIQGTKELSTFPEATYLGAKENGFLYNTGGLLTIEPSIPSADLDLDSGKLFIGNSSNKASQVQQITLDNLPPLGESEYTPSVIAGQIWRGTVDNKAELSNSLSIAEADLLFITSRFALNSFVVNTPVALPLVTPFSAQVLSALGGGMAKIIPITGRFAIAINGVDYVDGEQFDLLKGRVTEVETKVTTLQEQVTALEGSVEAIETDLAELNIQIDLMAVDLAALNLEVEGIAADLGIIDITVAGLSASVAALEAQILVINNDISTINTSITAINTRITSITANVVENKLLIGGATNSILSLTTDILPAAVQTNITSVGTVTSGTWNADTITVTKGGTGLTTTTANGVICGGTTSTNALQNAGTGTSGQVLTSAGNGAVPIWQTPSSGTLSSITAGTGLTGGTITTSGTIALDNTTVTAGSYKLADITVNSQGQITAATGITNTASTVLVSDTSNVRSFSSTLPTAVQDNITRYSTSIILPAATETYSYDSSFQNTSTSLINNFTLTGSALATNALSLKNRGATSFDIKYISSNLDITGYGGVDLIFTGTGGITKRPMRIFYSPSDVLYTFRFDALAVFNSKTDFYAAINIQDSGTLNLREGSTLATEALSTINVAGVINVPTPTSALHAANKDYVDSAAAGSLPSSLANQTLITDGANAKSFSSTLPAAVQTNITSLGTVATGTWNATTISVAKGGTGAITAAVARTNLAAAPNTSKYILQTADSELPNAQALSVLATGIVKNTTTTGLLSIATAGTDYYSLNNPTRLLDSGAAAFNLFVGKTAGNTTLTTAINSTGIGGNVLQNLTTGLNNSAFGAKCLAAITTNFNNTAGGALSLQSLGAGAGNGNTSYGANNLSQMTSGSNNTTLGTSAGTAYTTYNQCVLIGDSVDTTANSSSNAVGIGYNLTVPTNGVVIGNTNVTSIKLGKVSLPSATVANRLLYSSSTNTVAEILSVNSAVLLTNSLGVPAFTTGTTSQFLRGDGTFSNILGGSLGLGNTTPFTANSIQMANDVVNRKLVIYDVSNNDHQYYGLGINNGTLRYQTADNANHTFYAATGTTSSVEIARLTSSQNLIVGGLSTELARIVANGGVNNQVGQASCFRAISAITTSVEIQSTAVLGKLYEIRSTSSGNLDIVDRTAIASRIVIDTTGKVGVGYNGVAGDQLFSVNTSNPSKVGAGGWTAFSDQRIKNVLRTYNNGLNEILQLTPKVFKYNENSGYNAEDCEKELVGVIAQEVENILPECIVEKKDWNGIEDLRVFDMTPITYALINAVKELSNELNQLKQQIGK